MGTADLVPGVSGGSIALITGIYEKLLESINSIDKTALSLLFSFKFRELWSHINGNFLLSLLLGIFTAILGLSKLIVYLMLTHPIPLWSFFCGLIIIAAIIILRDIKRWRAVTVIALILGTVLAYWITSLPPSESVDAVWFTFVAGAIAICAMILPGISGSFLLLIMGQYERILGAVSDRDFMVLGLFGLGCIVGLLSFSRVISWLLKRYHDLTIALLSGFMLGSINKLWPWKRVLSYRMSSKGIQEPLVTQNILPQTYTLETGQDSLILYALLAFSFGFLLVLGIERTAYYLNRK